MRQLTFVEAGRLEWQDVPEPELEDPGDALVRPVVVTTCDADIAAIRGLFPIKGPFPFGHEFVAEVVELGDQVTGFHRGQLVILPVQISCGFCDRCRKGQTAFCRSVRQPAAWGLGAYGGNWPGAFCDLLRIPFADHMMVPVPHGVDPKIVASAGDNLSDAWRTVAPHLMESPGAEVLVVGYGSIGLFAVAIAHALGASRIDYLDTDATRLSLAESLGGSPIEGQPGGRVGSYAITVDASFNPAGLVSALRSVAPNGICTSIGGYFGDVSLPVFDMWRRAVRFNVGVANCRANMPQVLDLVQSGRIHPEVIASGEVPWDGAAEALADPSMKPLFVRDPVTVTASG